MVDSKFSQSIMTLLLGMVLSIIAFLILGYNEGLSYDKNIVGRLPTIKFQELIISEEGMIKLSGIPEVRTELKVPEYDKNLLFTKKVTEEKIENEWVVIRTDEAWANFKLLGVEIVPETTIEYLNLEQKYSEESETMRQTTYGFDVDSELIVIGGLKDGIIDGGDFFMISNKSNDVIESELKADIHFNWWLYKSFALLLLSFGIVALLLPLLAFLEIIKELGFYGMLLFVLSSIILAFLLIVIETLVFAFWFLAFFVLGFVIYLFIRINIKKKKKPINILPN